MYNVSMDGFGDLGAYNIPAKICAEGFDVVNHKGKYYCEKPESGVPYCPAGQSMRRQLYRNKDIKTCVATTFIAVDEETGVPVPQTQQQQQQQAQLLPIISMMPMIRDLTPQPVPEQSMDWPAETETVVVETKEGLPTWAWAAIAGGIGLVVLVGGYFILGKPSETPAPVATQP
jgi:hypothetical protein